jgi:hypothetical protein
MPPYFFCKSMILSWLRTYLCKSMILNRLREIAGSRQFGAKPIRARLLDRSLLEPHTELSTARSGCATGKAHELRQRKARADEFRACFYFTARVKELRERTTRLRKKR